MSYHRRYKLKDDRFGLLALTLREKAGLTQAEVAGKLGVSERTIRHWEAGTAYPASDNLKELIELYLCNSAFVSGHERDDAKFLWEQVVESAARRKPLFDDAWFDNLLKRQQQAQAERGTPEILHTLTPPQRTDWGEAIDVSSFYGREQEMQTIKEWVDGDRCRVMIMLGMGGIGKTTLSIRFAQEMTPRFDFVFWRSLRNAPPLEEWLTDCILTLSEQQSTPSLHHVEKNLALLLDLLRKRRCLLVLNNAETLLQPGNLEGGYREGYEGYGVLIQRVAETTHQSCLLLTSREMLSELEPLEGKQAAVRVLKLAGLGQAASQGPPADKDLSGSPAGLATAHPASSGNPLVLKIVAATVPDIFGGDIAAFVRADMGTLQTLRQLLRHQFARLVPLERDIMYWLAISARPSFPRDPARGPPRKAVRQGCPLRTARAAPALPD